jgi:hypothetical protein
LGALGLSAEDVRGFQLLASLGETAGSEFEHRWTGNTGGRLLLRRLVRLGLATRVPGRPPRYLAQNPGPVLDLRLTTTPAPDGFAPMLANITSIGVRPNGDAGDDRPLVTERCGPHVAADRVRRCLAAASERIRLMGRLPPVTLSWWSNAHLGLSTRGVDYRVLCAAAEMTDDLPRAQPPQVPQARQETRMLPVLPSCFCLVDSSCGLLFTDPDLIVVHPSTLLDGLSLLFDLLWQRALPIAVSDTDSTRGAPAETPDQRSQILSMMLSGLTDEAMARRLGIGYRTLQRRVADLMDEMGVRSRFQLGIQAALRSETWGSRSRSSTTSD